MDGDDKGFATCGACVLGIDKRKKKMKRLKTKYFSVHGIKKKLSPPHYYYYLSFSLLFTSEQEGRSGCSVSA